jgi:hypothetical protein
MNLTQMLLAPLFIHVAMTAIIGLLALRARVAAVKGGRARVKEIATSNGGWPADVRKISNNFDNQFQTPMLWYAACALLIAMGLVDGVSVGLSWLFLASRIAHTAIHTGRNVVMHRLAAFLVGYAALIAMWAWFGIRLFTAN